MQREAKKQMLEIGIGTKSQQALKLQQEQNKQDRKEKSYCTVLECTKEKLGNRNAFLHKRSSYKQESIQQMVQSDDC